MLKDLSNHFKRLEDQKRDLLRLMDGLTESERSKSPNPKELSPIQVLAHLVKVEETVAGNGTAPSPNLKVGIKGRIFMATMVNLMRPGFRIPTAPMLHPKTPDTYEELKRKWSEIRKSLASRVERITEASLDSPITNHMMAGPLSAPMALDFLNVHLAYHWKNFPRPDNSLTSNRK